MQYPLQRLEEGVTARVCVNEEEARGKRDSKKPCIGGTVRGYKILFSHL